MERIKYQPRDDYKCGLCGCLENLRKVDATKRIKRFRQFICKECLTKTYKCEVCGKDVRYLSVHKFEFTHLCKTCKTKKTISEDPLFYQKRNEKIKQTNLQRYGVENVFQIEEIKERSKQTCLEKFGTEHATQSKDIKEKVKNTLEFRYGISNAFQSEKSIQNRNLAYTEEWKQKIKKAHQKSPEEEKIILEKREKTCLEKYGRRNIFQTDDMKRKSMQTCLEKYGVPFSAKSKIVRNKTEQTCLERYGCTMPLNNPEVRQKAKDTLKRKYGSENAKTFRQFYDNQKFDSGDELIFYKFCKENNLTVKREPVRLEYYVNKQKHYYFPDFDVNEKLVEIKGDHLLNEKNELIAFYGDKHPLLEKTNCMRQNNVILIRGSELHELIRCGKLIEFLGLD